jgi:hypothetical protein
MGGWSAAVVGGGFGVDEEAADLGGVEFEGAFEGGDDLVDAGHGRSSGRVQWQLAWMRSEPWVSIDSTGQQ